MSAESQKDSRDMPTATQNSIKIIIPNSTFIYLALNYKLYDQLKPLENQDTLSGLTALYSS